MSDSTENILKSIMSDPETMNKISSVLSSLSENSEATTDDKADNSKLLPENTESLLKIGQIMNNFSKDDDDAVRLILALKPYLSEKRMESADKAIKILKLSHMTSLLGDIEL